MYMGRERRDGGRVGDGQRGREERETRVLVAERRGETRVLKAERRAGDKSARGREKSGRQEC